MQQPVLAIGPANYAGQAHEWARAVDRAGLARAWAFSHVPRVAGGFQFPADKMMGRYSYLNPVLRGPRARFFFRDATHVALDGFKSFYHLRQRDKFPGDVHHLVKSGLPVALIAHGSDVRSPEAHMEREKWSYFKEGTPQWRAALSASSAASRAFAEEAGLPVFYSTPDLGFDLPHGTWLPVCLDVDAWATESPVLERALPRVLHIPSRRNPPIKGTQYVEPILQELAAKGAIEHVQVESVPHSQMRALVQSCDIVIDQVLSGFYGVAAVEAMAAGRVTVTSLSEPVRERIPEAPEILNATPENLRQVLESILDDRDAARALAGQNRSFAKRWHDGTESAKRLAGFLGLDEVSGAGGVV